MLYCITIRESGFAVDSYEVAAANPEALREQLGGTSTLPGSDDDSGEFETLAQDYDGLAVTIQYERIDE